MSGEVEYRPAADSYTLLLIGKVDAASSPIDFNSEYDEAVDELEDKLINDAFKAMQTIAIDTAMEKLYQARDLRRKYLDLLERSAKDPVHPLSPRIPNLRNYAIDMDNLRFYLQTVVEAVREYTLGRGPDALRMLDRVDSISATDISLESLLSQNIKIMADNLTGLIRRGALDFAGARAAYDRASMHAQVLLEKISELRDEQGDEESETNEGIKMMLSGARYSQAANQASSYRMQYMQQMASFDYASAIDAARASSEAFLTSADCLSAFFPGLSQIGRASSFEALAEADIAKASLLLERREWDAASEMIGKVRGHYEIASRECLKSMLPSAVTTQESYLNTAFSWTARFRRELERERSYAVRIDELQVELRNFYGSLRGALAPAGITVNNATEMVTSVKQQVEVTNRIEANIRSLLHEIPDVLAATDLPASEKQEFTAEALHLAEDDSDRVTFFARAAKFAKRLVSAISTGAELAAPVVALLKALSVVS